MWPGAKLGGGGRNQRNHSRVSEPPLSHINTRAHPRARLPTHTLRSRFLSIRFSIRRDIPSHCRLQSQYSIFAHSSLPL